MIKGSKHTGNKGGRPKKEVSSFPIAWKEEIEALGKVGASKAEILAYLRIDDETLVAMVKRDHMFSAIIKQFLIDSEAWWVKHGRTKLDEKGFNAVLWYMNMKNRFGWKDKQEFEVKPAQEIAIKFSMPKK